MFKKPALAFIADALSHFDPDCETTLFLMREGRKRGFAIYHTEPCEIFVQAGQVKARVKELRLKEGNPFYEVKSEVILPLEFFSTLFLRKDPPFDLAYMEHLQCLCLLRGRVPMINDPQGILSCGEKIWPQLFPELCPSTLVSAKREEILSFAEKYPHGVVLKPLGFAGGRGIVLLTLENRASWGHLASQVSSDFSRHIVVQEFLPQVSKGDKRILLWKGKILGVFTRLAKEGNFLANLHAGGRAHKADLTARDQNIVTRLLEPLSELGLHFVGLDIIDGHLTEVNITSPMGLAEINTLEKIRSEELFFDEITA